MPLTTISGTVRPVLDPGVRNLCIRPYPGHPHGCPNHGRRPSCPPQAPTLDRTLDLDQSVYVVANVFQFGEHVARMRAIHPAWSDRQCACCLYWQGGARRKLRTAVDDWLTQHPAPTPWRVIRCPEAQGVNLTETMRGVGVELEWPPVRLAYQIVLVGKPTERT